MDQLERLQKQPQQQQHVGQSAEKGISKQVNDVEAELERVLNNKWINPEQRLAQYSQLLRRYIMMDEELRQPMTIHLKEPIKAQSPSGEPAAREWSNEEVLKGILKNKRGQAEMLMHYIRQNDRITWNDRGKVKVDGQLVLGSHLIDLVHDFTRDRRTREAATGHVQLAKAYIHKMYHVKRSAILIGGKKFKTTVHYKHHTGQMVQCRIQTGQKVVGSLHSLFLNAHRLVLV